MQNVKMKISENICKNCVLVELIKEQRAGLKKQGVAELYDRMNEVARARARSCGEGKMPESQVPGINSSIIVLIEYEQIHHPPPPTQL